MKKNGFTLIELLAVIVILAIIALITVPVVLSAIGTARTGASKESARNFVSAAEFYCAQQLMAGSAVPTFSAGAVTVKGTAPTVSGTFNYNASTCVLESAAGTVNGYTLAQLNA